MGVPDCTSVGCFEDWPEAFKADVDGLPYPVTSTLDMTGVASMPLLAESDFPPTPATLPPAADHSLVLGTPAMPDHWVPTDPLMIMPQLLSPRSRPRSNTTSDKSPPYPSPPVVTADMNEFTDVMSRPRARRAPSSSDGSMPDANEPLVHLAIAGGQLETLRFLLADGHVSVNVRDSAGYTPLQRAVMSGRTAMVALLIQAGADINE
jgi:hypothetical protein